MSRSSVIIGAVLGSPVSHSLSPTLYRAAFSELGIDGDYIARECSVSDVAAIFAELQTQDIRALSITMPLKEAIIPLLSSVDSNAALLNAVNCVSFVGAVPIGHNTDGDGCCDALEEQGAATLSGTRSVVLGAGGTARSVALALGRRGSHVVVVNRTHENAEALCRRLLPDIESHGGHIRIGTQSDVRDAHVLVNATSVGMNSTATPLPSEFLHSDLVVLDAVYQPMVTTLLRDAQQAGAVTVDGLWMLIQQARRQCVHQFGQKPSVHALRLSAERELSHRQK